MEICEPKILVDGEHMNVVQCLHCKRMGFYYNNVLIGFNTVDFFNFTNSVTALDFDKSSVYFSDRKRHLIISTCHDDIQLTFTRNEFEELVDMLNQACLLVEAEYYVNKKA